jgi:PmbA protein
MSDREATADSGLGSPKASAVALLGTDAVARALARAKQAGASEADAMLLEADSISARVRGAEIDFVTQARERVLGIRTFVRQGGGLSCGSTSTSDLAPETIDRMADEAVALAHATAPDRAAGLPEGGFATDAPSLALFDPADRHVAVEARIDDAKRAEAAARALDPRIVNSEGSQVESEFRRVVYGNSAGFVGTYESASHSLFSEPLARENESLQRDYWLTAARSLGALEDAAAVGRRAAERALRRLSAKRVATCEVPVLFEPLVARSLLSHIAGCVSGGAIYRETSFLAGKLGERIASELVTVIDDGRLPGGLGSRPFDGEGQPTRRNVIVDQGVLKTYLLDSYSARKLGMQSTGSAARGAAGSPSPSATNLWLEPGKLSPEEMIRRTARGLLVTELIGMGFNAVTGDYSRGAAGLWIEDGRVVHAVEEITIAGHLGEMLASIDLVGSDLLWAGSTAAPTVRVASMTIAGS